MKAPLEMLEFDSLPDDIRLRRVTTLPTVLEEAREAAIEEAYERGRREARKDLADCRVKERESLRRLEEQVLQQVSDCVPRLIQEGEKALVALSIDVAEKLISGLPVSQEGVIAAVKEALEEVKNTNDIRVQLHPEDLALLEEVNGSQGLPVGHQSGLRLESSPKVARGGCLLVTRFGIIDGRRETKLNRLREDLLG